MKIGNLSQTVLKRSVLKQLKNRREEVFIEPSVEETCSGILLGEEAGIILSSTATFGDEKDLGCYGIAKTVNDVTSRGADPIGVEIVIQLPPYAYESRLKAMVGYMEMCCAQNRLQILGIKASVNPIIDSSIINVTAIGSVLRSQVKQLKSAQDNYDIVLLGGVGTEGALRILYKRQEEIEKRFIPTFFTELKECKKEIIAIEPIKLALNLGAESVHQLGEGGILAALWELGEAATLGMEVDLKKITIRQDVIEVCEFVGVNPYQLSSTGSALIVVKDGKHMVEELNKNGYKAIVIGKTTNQRERVIWSGGEKRYLDRPTQGELLKLYDVKGASND